MNSKQLKSLELIADSIESGYSSLFTYAVKENLNANERQELSQFIKELSRSSK